MKFISVERDGAKKKVERSYKVDVKKPEKSIDELSLGFIRSSFFYLLLAIIGLVLNEFVGNFANTIQDALLWGFMVTFLYGFSYLILPDVHHRQVYSRGTLIGQYWLHFLGVLLILSMGVTTTYLEGSFYGQLHQLGVLFMALGGLMFLFNMHKSL